MTLKFGWVPVEYQATVGYIPHYGWVCLGCGDILDPNDRRCLRGCSFTLETGESRLNPEKNCVEIDFTLRKVEK